jgi:squalene-hopene/tetraprenyl-beta-curcumene cyclase
MITTATGPRTADPVPLAIHRAQQNLLRLQHPDGYWCGELMVDSTLCSDYILYMHWSGKLDEVLQDKCVAHIRRRQLGDGGWNIYEGGPSEINATVKAYFALKLAGHSPDAPWMREARAAALRLGGIPRMNTYAKLYLALLGQFPWKYLPAIPVELILLPDWFFFNIYEMSSWSRAMLMPLAILNHLKPTRQLPAEKHLHELYPAGLEHTDLSLPRNQKFFSLGNFFISATELFRVFESPGMAFLRDSALEKAKAWMIERMGEGCDGLAAVFPAMLNSIIALRALGYPDDDPLLQKAVSDFEGLFVDDPEDFRIQPCLSPVWDTAINIVSLTESGLDPMSEPLQRAANWMYTKEVRIRADWAKKNPHPIASGWAFEFNNVFYPDTDDTAMVLIGLRMIGSKSDQDAAHYQQMFQRALDWLLSFQCRDGGWAAFDRDVTKSWLEDVPFADHNAILDPTCSDLTGRTLELLGYIGVDLHCRRVQRAIQFLKDTQEEDGSWYGRWGVNYIYGTWQVLRGLRAIGVDMKQDWLIRAREWLESCQNEDGGWGETCASYDDPMLKGKGPSTASQTAWAVMGLCAAGSVHSKAVQRGVDFLVTRQNRDGSWSEPETTGTGFPKVFYLRYDMYRNNFPLLALATYENYRSGVFHRATYFKV